MSSPSRGRRVEPRLLELNRERVDDGPRFLRYLLVEWRRRYLYELLRQKKLLPRRQEAERASGLCVWQ